MTTKRRKYTADFKREAVQLWQTSGRTAAEIEQELGISAGLPGCRKRKLADVSSAGDIARWLLRLAKAPRQRAGDGLWKRLKRFTRKAKAPMAVRAFIEKYAKQSRAARTG